MPGWPRLGDKDSAGAPIIAGVATTVFINGRPAALLGSKCSPHPVNHPMSSLIGCSKTIICQGKPAGIQFGVQSCGHIQIQASTDVIIS